MSLVIKILTYDNSWRVYITRMQSNSYFWTYETWRYATSQ